MRDERFRTFDGVATRFAGWLAIGLAVTEVADPTLLAINMHDAAGLAVAGVLLGTGRAQALVEFLKRALRDE